MNPATLRQFIRFAIVGAAASVTHVAAALALIEQAGVAVMTANALAFCVAVFVSYSGNHIWTFRADGRHGIHFPRFFATALAGLALNQAIVFVATEQFGWGYLPAILIVVTLVPLTTFAASKLWAFAGTA
jgi:putative flippase GtrA